MNKTIGERSQSMNIEQQIMELIVNGGDAREKALEAVSAAAEGDFSKSEDLLNECKAALNKAHEVQTELIQAELNGDDRVHVSLLMVHAQDHLMNAITVKDLAERIITLSKAVYRSTIEEEK